MNITENKVEITIHETALMKAGEHPSEVIWISGSMFFLLSLLELISLLRPGVNLAAIELSVFLIAVIAAGLCFEKSRKRKAGHQSKS